MIINEIITILENKENNESLTKYITRLDENFFINLNDATKLFKRAKKINLTKLGFEPFSIAVLTNHTPNIFLPFLYAAGFSAKLDLEIYSPGYDRIIEQVTNNQSDLYRSQPKTVFIYYLLENRLGEQYLSTISRHERKKSVDNLLNEIDFIVSTLRKKLPSTRLVIHNFHWFYPPALGYLDNISQDGPADLLDYLDINLREITRKIDSCYVLDIRSLVSRIGFNNWRDPNRWYAERIDTVNGAMYLAKEYLKFIKSFTKRNRKVIVLDLDNTLWGGLAGEDGIEGVKIGGDYPGNAYQNFQYVLKQLRMKGVLLAINSKNNHDDVLPIINKHPEMILREEDFVMVKCNWENKADNIREIAKTLNLGLDSFIFLDDNPVERQLMREMVPEVLVPEMSPSPSGYPAVLFNLNDLDYPVYSETDRNRTQMYREETGRIEFSKGADDYESYLRLLKTEVILSEAKESDLARLEQMFQRTNQFNMTTKRYSMSELKSFLKDRNYLFVTARLKDKFGDSGLVGTALLYFGDKAIIDSFLMSCRVIGRKLETVVLTYLALVANKRNYSHLYAEFIRTKKNKPSKHVYPEHAFKQFLNSEDKIIYYVSLQKENKKLKYPDYLKINFE